MVLSLEYNDDNNTRCAQSYEEWVVKEMTKFDQSAVTNLDVGLINNHNYENGTWFVNPWIPPPRSQPQPQNPKCRPQNTGNKILCVDTVMCQCETLNITKPTISRLADITAGSNPNCSKSRPRKRRRTSKESTIWSRSTWSGTGGTPSASSSSSGRRCRVRLTGRRRLTIHMDVDTLCVGGDDGHHSKST